MTYNDDQRIQILLKEYEICNNENNALEARLWQFIVIIVVLVAALIGFTADANLLNSLGDENHDYEIFVIGFILILFPLISIIVFSSFRRSYEVNNLRMIDIENALDMKKTIYIYASSNLEKLSENEKQRLRDIHFNKITAWLSSTKAKTLAINIPPYLVLALGIAIIIVEFFKVSPPGS